MNSQGDNKISKLFYKTEDVIVLQEIFRELVSGNLMSQIKMASSDNILLI